MNEVDPVDAQRLIEAGAVLIDVREPSEWDAGHAPGAVHVPAGQLDVEPLPQGSPRLLVCRSGGRSGRAQAALAAAGQEAVNVVGGMTAWCDAGLPVVTDHGEPGAVI